MFYVLLSGSLNIQPAEQRSRIFAANRSGIFEKTFQHSLIQRLAKPAWTGAESNNCFAVQNVFDEQGFVNIITSIFYHAFKVSLSSWQWFLDVSGVHGGKIEFKNCLVLQATYAEQACLIEIAPNNTLVIIVNIATDSIFGIEFC
jgi:hypothetical protein